MADQKMTFTYSTEDFTASLSTEEYIRKYSNSECFIKYCKECRNYGKLWSCPPFVHDTMAELRQYSNVFLVATKIIPDGKEIPFSEAKRFFRPERLRLEKKLLDMEAQYDGRALAFAGSCLYCPEGTCSRLSNQPCRHPELVRPSLESYGFDLGRTASELFGFPLLWSTDGYLPQYLTLICGLFHNAASVSFP
jgi:predicted metal-binding protein